MGLVRLRGVSMPLCLYTPIHLDTYHTFRHPHLFRVLIGYLFCYFIKCFPIRGVYIPPMFIHPHTFGHPHMFR